MSEAPCHAADRTALRFRCTGCGACCDGPPEVRLGEGLAYADAFVLQLGYVRETFARPGQEGALAHEMRATVRGLPGVDGRDPVGVATQLRDHHRSAVDTVVVDREGPPGLEQLVFPAFRAVDTALAPRCPQLQADGRCGVYDRRPAICRTVPAAWAIPEALAEDYVRAFTRRPGYRCDTSAGAPVMFRDGALVSLEYRRERDRAATAGGEAERRLAHTLVHAGTEGWPLLPTRAEILVRTNGEQTLLAPWAAALMPTVAAGVATEAAAAAAARRQLELLRATRAANDARRTELAADVRRAGFTPGRIELDERFRARFVEDPERAAATARLAAMQDREHRRRGELEALLEQLLRATLPFARPGFMSRWRRDAAPRPVGASRRGRAKQRR